MNTFKYICAILLTIVLYSCFSNQYEYIGEKKIVNKEDWRVKIYQKDEFDMATPISYQVVDENDSSITRRYFLIGTNDKLKNVDGFYAKIQDSILYMCYPYPEVVAIKHLSALDSSNQWDLIKKLQKYDTSLYRSGEHPAGL
ncbi:hypothetical protein MHTCC0001_14120 [Flavobacteriaceae bacterium MHTCC 0001]